MPTTSDQVKVGFLFFTSGNEWQGGKNYYRSLFGALDRLPGRRISPVALVGLKTDVAKLELPPSVEVVQDACLDRFSPSWFLDKISRRLGGPPLRLRRVLRANGIRVLSHTGSIGDPSVRSISWIPDFQHMHLPDFFTDEELTSRSALYRSFIADTDAVVLSSQAAFDDMVRFAPDSGHKGRVLRFSAVRPKIDGASVPDVVSIYGLEGPYFYIPNQFWAHKNHAVVIEALATVLRTVPDVKVVCSGALSDYRNPRHVADLKARLQELNLNDRFLLLGLIPYEHIAPLMFHAVAVINPSHFEGWSTTVEEAKAIGVPMILSDLQVHREQCPDGSALFFEPRDAAALARHMIDMLGSTLGRRSRTEREAMMARSLSLHEDRTAAFAENYQQIVLEVAGRR